MKKQRINFLPVLLFSLFPAISQAFCGFYVAKADSKLFNKASQVVMVRDEDRTVLSMSNDFQGDVKDFAVVIPVPTFIERGQIHVADRAIIEHLDAYSAPRLVEYFDEAPCAIRIMERAMMSNGPALGMAKAKKDAKSLGVTIEASYTVGEYDILILSAEQSGGLVTWLKQNNYRIPDGAEPVINSYIKQDMRFFVAKVNLEEQAKLGFSYLRPIQVAYESEKFMLPIRLGMINADGQQELYVYLLNRTGKVETRNYRTVKIPSDINLPVHIKNDFGNFYADMFARQTKKEDNRAVFMEYAWDMNWCDPCAADPLSRKELQELGVFWLDDTVKPIPIPRQGIRPGIMPPQPRPQNIFLTRLHLRYDQEHFPEDLFFQSTGDRSNFQGRYIIRHPWNGKATCKAAEDYLNIQLPNRQREEAKNLAKLTGWNIEDIRKKIPGEIPEPEQEPWWKKIWK